MYRSDVYKHPTLHNYIFSIMKFKILLAAFIGIMLFLIPDAGFTRENGAPSNRVGAPTRAGDGSTCGTNGCHDSFTVDSGSGTLSLAVPDQFEAGDTINITIRVEESGAVRYGFQATVRGVNDLVRSTGEILLSNGTKFSDALGEYITHSSSVETTGAAEWTFRWVAPETDVQNIVVYAAAVAGNGANSANQDHVYTTNSSVPVSTSIESTNVPESFEVYAAYPNPFHSISTITYSLNHPEPVQFAMYDALGRLVKSMDEGYKQAGTHEILINGDDLPTGTYYYRIHTPSSQKTHTLTRIR